MALKQEQFVTRTEIWCVVVSRECQIEVQKLVNSGWCVTNKNVSEQTVYSSLLVPSLQ